MYVISLYIHTHSVGLFIIDLVMMTSITNIWSTKYNAILRYYALARSLKYKIKC